MFEQDAIKMLFMYYVAEAMNNSNLERVCEKIQPYNVESYFRTFKNLYANHGSNP